MSTNIVDAHVHVWLEESLRHPHHYVPGLSPPSSAPVEQLVTEMDNSGVSQAVLVQPAIYRFDNSYLADCVRRYPGRFAGVGNIDVRAEAPAETLVYWVKERGIQGVRFAPLLDELESTDSSLRHPAIREIWEQAARLGVPVCLLIAPSHIGEVEKLIRDYPEVTVIIDHLGRPDVSTLELSAALQPLLGLAQYSSVYVKISGLPVISGEPYPYLDTFTLIEKVYERFGAQRMMWATDFPHILGQCGYGKALDIMRQLPFLTRKDREWILGKVALTLWGLDE